VVVGAWVVSAVVAVGACGGRSSLDDFVAQPQVDGGHAIDAGLHPSRDAGMDSSHHLPVDSGHDADAAKAVDANPPVDAPVDAAVEARVDAPKDALVDAPRDSSPDGCVSMCVPLTCADVGGLGIGVAPDGCGGEVSCGECACVYAGLPESCLGAVTVPPDAWLDIDCCHGPCTPVGCAQLGTACGLDSDGCGNVLDCGPCNADGTCPGGGKAGVCSICTPKTCAAAGLNCGSNDDGCGGTVECGTCDPCIPCNDGVCAGVLVSQCKAMTCESLGFTCGQAADTCGGLLECGSCASPLSCLRGVCAMACE